MEKILVAYKNALLFYADEDTYCDDRQGSPIGRDYGEMARNALEMGKSEKTFETYKKVLTFYASEDTYNIAKFGPPIEEDYGEMARKVLVKENIKEESGEPDEPNYTH